MGHRFFPGSNIKYHFFWINVGGTRLVPVLKGNKVTFFHLPYCGSIEFLPLTVYNEIYVAGIKGKYSVYVVVMAVSVNIVGFLRKEKLNTKDKFFQNRL